MSPRRRIAVAIHPRIRPNEFGAKSRQFRLQQTRAQHTRRLQVRLPSVKIGASMQNRTKQTRRRHCRRTSLIPHGGGTLHNDYILTMRRYDRGRPLDGPDRHSPPRPDKRHPARLLIWSPGGTVQAQGRPKLLRARLTVRFFKRKQRCRRTGRLLNRDFEEPDMLSLNAQFRGLADRVPDAVRCALYPCCSMEDVAMRKIDLAPSSGGIEPAHALELSTIRSV